MTCTETAVPGAQRGAAKPWPSRASDVLQGARSSLSARLESAAAVCPGRAGPGGVAGGVAGNPACVRQTDGVRHGTVTRTFESLMCLYLNVTGGAPWWAWMSPVVFRIDPILILLLYFYMMYRT